MMTNNIFNLLCLSFRYTRGRPLSYTADRSGLARDVRNILGAKPNRILLSQFAREAYIRSENPLPLLRRTYPESDWVYNKGSLKCDGKTVLLSFTNGLWLCVAATLWIPVAFLHPSVPITTGVAAAIAGFVIYLSTNVAGKQ